MHFIYGVPICPPICPPLGNNNFVSSSEENLDHRTKYLPNQNFHTYTKQIGRHFIHSNSSSKENFSDEKDINEEYDLISLSDNYYVSLL